MFASLTCKDFNIETQVDPNFIHCVWFGWNGFTNTSASQLSADLATAQTVFKQQHEYRLIETRCKDLKAANFPITNIVVLGNGSISRPYSPHGAQITDKGYYGLAGGAIDQLATIMEIRRLLGGSSRRPGLRPLAGKSKINGAIASQSSTLTNILELDTAKALPCIFQDPQTCRFEKQFLRSLGHTVVNDPDAFGLINANSLVIYIHNPGMEAYILKGVWPAAIVAWKSDGIIWPEDLDYDHEQEDLELHQFEEAYKVLPFMESKIDEGVMKKKHQRTHKYNFHLRKDLDGAAEFSFSV
jgi:hypothetical protein